MEHHHGMLTLCLDFFLTFLFSLDVGFLRNFSFSLMNLITVLVFTLRETSKLSLQFIKNLLSLINLTPNCILFCFIKNSLLTQLLQFSNSLFKIRLFVFFRLNYCAFKNLNIRLNDFTGNYVLFLVIAEVFNVLSYFLFLTIWRFRRENTEVNIS